MSRPDIEDLTAVLLYNNDSDSGMYINEDYYMSKVQTHMVCQYV